MGLRKTRKFVPWWPWQDSNLQSPNFNDLQSHEVDLLRKEIYLELRTLKETALNSFIFDIQQILSTNHLDKS
jgi:hypothetical protein